MRCSYICSYNTVRFEWDERKRALNLKKHGIDFADNAIRIAPRKKQVTLRVDADVLEFFRKRGKGYQTAINLLLRRYMDAQKKRAS